MLRKTSFVIAGCVLWLAGWAMGSVIQVGSGSNTAGLVINFKDGGACEFAVKFDGAVTGIGLLDIVQANTSLIVEKQDFGFGEFVDGFAFNGHANRGWGGGDDWWQYWTGDSGLVAWKASMIGASDRVVKDGQFDGWVYGRATAPVVPEPAGLAIIFAAACLLLRRTHA